MRSLFISATVSMMILAAASQNALAWGPTGHRVVGEIAQRYLSKKANRKLTELLQGQSLARVSNWPDEIRSDPATYSHTFPWHYTDWPDGHDHYDPTNNNGSLITAIENNIKVIQNKNSKPEEVAFAVKFLVHLIGDLHMPLHVGNGLDRGGNSCKVVFQKASTNLHKLWDEDMIDFTHLSFTEMADFIDIISKDERKAIQQGGILDWAKESKDLRAQIYPKEVVTDPAQNMSVKNYCQKDVPLPPEQLPQLGYDYSYQFVPVVYRRLLQGGLRLSMVLNELFD